ncbi:ParB-like nuclease domain-containing protein [Actinomadura barringtoniae]|uniref:ParB-like nuclease domain-containing protein n=1 Tax=Actinomadura barringtoniae TaxID=1427535 RepID=A0A939PIE2_9ACTN|nr:ParB-like nuclease domain-containing protein [Actinomadura barringtoniae]MBO2453281.1 ParB-like nuclease domain-containing protein [Actinomadura barringtoniae]
MGEKPDREVTMVAIDELHKGESPRSGGIDSAHVTRLAELSTPLPPILVDRRTMRVVDGTHRLLAALLRGQSTIAVEFFDGKPEDAFLRAVEANAVHGLPLSAADRLAAAEKIIDSHPHMSDRAIALAVGMGTRSIAKIRRSTEAGQQLNARVGRDGRVRPVNGDEGRLRAVEVLTQRPDASLREVARIAGISPATVSDVRKRLAAGESAVLPNRKPVSAATPPPPADPPEPGSPAGRKMDPADDLLSDDEREYGAEELPHARLKPSGRIEAVDPTMVLEKLWRDPSIRQKEEGRQLLRLLRQNTLDLSKWTNLLEAVPAHWGTAVAELARQYSDMWHGFAEELDERTRPEHVPGS